MEIIAARNDYLGINYYTRQCVAAVADNTSMYYSTEVPQGAETTSMGWEVYPEGLYRLLISLNTRYQLPPIVITENGMANDDQYDEVQVSDGKRVAYFREHLQAVERAITKGVEIQGYFAWSLLDNFEWAEGYSKRFGLYYVDYESQERVPKLSALFYKEFIARAR